MSKINEFPREVGKKPYRLGLYEKAMPIGLSFPEKLQIVKETGFDYLEVSIDETDEKLARLEASPEEIEGIREAMRETGVRIRTLCLSAHRRFPLGSHDETVERRSLQIMEKAIAFSDQLGIRIIQLAGYDVYYETSDAGTKERFEANLRACVQMAAAKGVLLGFETMETPFMDTVSKAMTYVDRIGSPYLGIYPDIGNLKNAAVLYGHDLLADIEAGDRHIIAAHLKETTPGVYRDMRFGSGHTEYEACIEVLYGMGVRMFTGEFWYGGEADYTSTISEANRFLRSRIEHAISFPG